MTDQEDKMYIDRHGNLVMVLEEYPGNIVRGITLNNFTIQGISIRSDLSSRFYGHGGQFTRKNKVIFKS